MKLILLFIINSFLFNDLVAQLYQPEFKIANKVTNFAGQERQTSVCPQGSVTLSTQARVDLFALSYPNCTKIDGSLTIDSDSINEIVDLNGLSNIQTITRNLTISSNNNLNNLLGLRNLRSIGSFSFNGAIGGRLQIENNNQLSNLAGLENTDFFSLVIQNNINLNDCAIANICDFLEFNFNGDAVINNNASSCDSKPSVSLACDNLPDCPTGDIILTSDAEILSFLNTYNCVEINGNFIIDGSNSTITNQPFLGTFYSEILKITGDVIIKDTELTTLSYFETLTEIGGDLQVINNNNLAGIRQFDDLGSVAGSLVLTDNEICISIEFDKLNRIDNELIISNNASLKNLYGIENIEISINASLVIKDNMQLSICNQQNICSFLENTTSQNNIVSGNAIGCKDIDQISKTCQGTLILPTAAIDGNNIVIINEKETITFSQSSSNYESLLWNSGDGQTSTNSQADFTYNIAGTYTATLEATNANGSDTASITVIVNVVILEECTGDNLIYTTPNSIQDSTHAKIRDWILFPEDSDTIKVENDVIVSFKAGQYIEIKNDFEVEVGAELLLDIEDCE